MPACQDTETGGLLHLVAYGLQSFLDVQQAGAAVALASEAHQVQTGEVAFAVGIVVEVTSLSPCAQQTVGDAGVQSQCGAGFLQGEEVAINQQVQYCGSAHECL